MSKFKDVDKGWMLAMANLKKIDHSFVTVGVQDGSEKAQFKGLPLVLNPKFFHSASELETIAWVHEFGSNNIPERSFIRSSFDENKPDIKNITQLVYSNVLLGRKTVRQGLKIIGARMVDHTKNKIIDLKTPPLKNPTRRRRGATVKNPVGSTNPLVDTGQLVQSIISREVLRVR